MNSPQLSAEITGSVFAPVSLLNRMRREAVETLEELQSRPLARVIHPTPDLAARNARRLKRRLEPSAQIHLLVRNPEQMEAAIAAKPDSITLDYLDLYGLAPFRGAREGGGSTGSGGQPAHSETWREPHRGFPG